jgi:lysozyme family protein
MKIQDIIAAAKPHGIRFQNWLAFVMTWECVLRKDGTIISENDPSDPGGLTFAGIDKRSHPDFNYRNPSADAVVKCYFADYWTPSKAAFMDFPTGEVVANFAVNMGLGASVKLLQRAVNVVSGANLAIDGGLGQKTLSAANACDSRRLADVIEDEADARYRRIADANPKLRKFLQGWYNRDNALEKWWMNLPH